MKHRTPHTNRKPRTPSNKAPGPIRRGLSGFFGFGTNQATEDGYHPLVDDDDEEEAGGGRGNNRSSGKRVVIATGV